MSYDVPGRQGEEKSFLSGMRDGVMDEGRPRAGCELRVLHGMALGLALIKAVLKRSTGYEVYGHDIYHLIVMPT